jgi:7-carboxy-7-deazaguanine synthase
MATRNSFQLPASRYPLFQLLAYSFRPGLLEQLQICLSLTALDIGSLGTGNWGAGELANRGAGELGSWRIGELANWGAGELGSWEVELKSWKLVAGSGQREAGGWKLGAGSWELDAKIDSSPVMLTINEIFHSIQGESTHTGRPCVFVRLTACDLRCSWCDTTYAFHEGHKATVDEVVSQVGSYGCDLVEITGGEPLLQRDVYPLMHALLARGHEVMIETGGHLSVADVPDPVVRIIDVKCPGSGEAGKNHWPNLVILRPQDEIKFVIRDRADYEYARTVVARHDLTSRAAAVLFSPVHDELAPADLAGWILEDRLSVRLQLQSHKYIWGAHVRGV